MMMMLMQADCLRERMRASMEVSRIGFLKLIFSREEKFGLSLGERAIRFDSECRDIFDGCYVVRLPKEGAPFFLVEQHPIRSARENEIYDLAKRRPRRKRSVRSLLHFVTV